MRLRRSDPSAAGIRRRRHGRGFVYRNDVDGAKVTDAETLDRIRALAIPPAWEDVWICLHPRGHIQATGVDARGRRQYRYHDQWRLRRDREKFDHMLEFAAALPSIRQACFELLQTDGLGRDRVLACAVRLLDLGFFRIGTEGYAEENQTYGLATIRRRHVSLDGGGLVTFDFTAKGGKRRIQSVVDAEVCAVVEALMGRRGGGYELLAYEANGGWCDVRSADINLFIKELSGADFSAKDFRTWSATVLAAVALAVSTEARSATARKRAVARAMQEVAHYLGNTPAVVRKSYVDPRVVDRFAAGQTIADELAALGDGVAHGHLATQGAVEAAVLALLGGDATPYADAA